MKRNYLIVSHTGGFSESSESILTPRNTVRATLTIQQDNDDVREGRPVRAVFLKSEHSIPLLKLGSFDKPTEYGGGWRRVRSLSRLTGSCDIRSKQSRRKGRAA